ncbi:MAG: glycosyltransferase [Bacteroidota bacterium]
MYRIIKISDSSIIDTSSRPIRQDDMPATSNADFQYQLLSHRSYDNDETKEGNTYSKDKAINILERFSFLKKNLAVLRKASLIFCSNGSDFILLGILKVLKLISRDTDIVRMVYKNEALSRVNKLSFIKSLLKVFVITKEQNILYRWTHYFPYMIDTEWYRCIDSKQSENYWLCPGNADRDDDLLKQIFKGSDEKVLRVGRSSQLSEIYSEEGYSNIEIVANPSHLKYLELLRNCKGVILPITVSSDEPAGYTAALEALSCGKRVLSTDSIAFREIIRVLPNAPISLIEHHDFKLWDKAISLNETSLDKSYIAKLEEVYGLKTPELFWKRLTESCGASIT